MDEAEIVSIVIDDVIVEEIIIVIIIKVYVVVAVVRLTVLVVKRFIIGCFMVRLIVMKVIVILVDIVHWQGVVVGLGSRCVVMHCMLVREQWLRLVDWCETRVYVPIEVFQVQILQVEEAAEHFVWNLYLPCLEDDIGECNYD